jgi:hypothetical protein
MLKFDLRTQKFASLVPEQTEKCVAVAIDGDHPSPPPAISIIFSTTTMAIDLLVLGLSDRAEVFANLFLEVSHEQSYS